MESNLWLDTRRVSTKGENKGKYHIKLCVDFYPIVNGKRTRKQKRYETNLYASMEEFDILFNSDTKTKRQDLRDLHRKLLSLKVKADDLLQSHSSQQAFEMAFLSKGDLNLVKTQFEIIINQKLNARPKPKIKTASFYRHALNSLIEFAHADLTFEEITPEFLYEWQNWFISKRQVLNWKNKRSNSLTTVGMYARHLMAVFNNAIKVTKVVPESLYPFGKGKYIIPRGGREVKIFMELEDKNKFLAYKPLTPERAFFYDIAVFDYYANGINFADILDMKIGNVFAEHIEIIRTKTDGNTNKQKKILIVIHPRMREIMQRRGNKSLDPDEYVFPIYKKGLTWAQMEETKMAFIQNTNKHLEKIRKELGIAVKITTYTLRHTFSYHFMQNGGTLAELQDAHAHGSIKTTENYNHGFGLARKKELSSKL